MAFLIKALLMEMNYRHIKADGPNELINKGFKAYGMNGLIIFRKSHQADRQNYENSLLSTIKFKPRLFG